VDRDSQGREGMVELSPTETVYVGRGLECAIRTDDGMVSRRHSQIRMEGGRFVVEDLGSANGTLLNNTRVQKQALGHADVIQCGSLMIRFIDEGAVNVVQQPLPAGGAAPPQKGGTMGVEPHPEPPPAGRGVAGGRARRGPGVSGADPPAPPPPSNPGGGGPYGGLPQMPSSGPPQMPSSGPPQMPSGASIPPMSSPATGFGPPRGGGFGG